MRSSGGLGPAGSPPALLPPVVFSAGTGKGVLS